MKQLLALLLLLGAMTGLWGQEAAFAAGPSFAPVMAMQHSDNQADMPMSADCMAMMQNAPQPGQKPCKGMTLDCIAAMGCVIPLGLVADVYVSGGIAPSADMHFALPAVTLTGRTLNPEPEPPATLI